MKRLCADDSADPRVKVGHRQANIRETPGSRRAFSSLKSVIYNGLQPLAKAKSSITRAL